MFDYMPEQASHWAASVDWVNNFITNTAIICTVLITGTMIFFALRYRRHTANQQTAFITHNLPLETVWTAIPTVIVIFTFYYGYASYHEMRTPPANPLEINVEASSWKWEFEYSNGKKVGNVLTVPLGRAVRLIMTAKKEDVLHSLFIPAMRVKEDIRPGSYSYLWFLPTKLGEFHLFCAEYCGTNHSAMIGKVNVVSEEQYQDFVNDRSSGEVVELTPAELGLELFSNKNMQRTKGCYSCHSIDGTPGVGPSLKGLFASKTKELEDGTKVEVDENYVRESIVNPRAKIVKGFSPIMQSFEGSTDKEIAALIAYLKTL